MLLSMHVTRVLGRFNNFALTTGFYWSYTLLLKSPVLMRSCHHFVLSNIPITAIMYILDCFNTRLFISECLGSWWHEVHHLLRAQYVLLFLVLRSYSSHPFLGSWWDYIEVQLSSQMLQYTILSPCRELLVCFSNMCNKSMENGR